MQEFVFRVDFNRGRREFSLPLRDFATARVYAGRTLELLLAARALHTGSVAVGRGAEDGTVWLGSWRTVEQGPFAWTELPAAGVDRASSAERSETEAYRPLRRSETE